MNLARMSSTTEDSDWEAKIVPRSRQLSSASQNSSLPKSQPRMTPQPILPRTTTLLPGLLPGQLVFSLSTPAGYRTQNPIIQTPVPHPQFPIVNQSPFPHPPFTAPVNPAVARVIHQHATGILPPLPLQTPPTPDTIFHATSLSTPTPLNPRQQLPLHQPAPTPMENNPEYQTPPSRPIRGVKRGTARGRGGARKPKIKVETPTADDASLLTATPLTGTKGSAARSGGRPRGAAATGRVNRGGRPRGSRAGASSARGTKRKREPNSEEKDKDDSDVSEIITPLPTQTRSGRKIIQANPVVIDLDPKPTPSQQPSATVPTVEPQPAAATTAAGNRGRGKKRTSRPGEASVCKNCGRGHSPASNMIVFCDGCNGPWHQHCHDPPIPRDVIRIEEREWFCADCLVLREERAHVEGNVSAEGMSVVEKRNYLLTLPHSHLISLLLHATILHPTLPIFSATPAKPPNQPRKPITNHPVDGQQAGDEEEDEEDDLYPDAEVLPYPKAGNGVELPKEGDFLAMLVDEDIGVYSHVWDWRG